VVSDRANKPVCRLGAVLCRWRDGCHCVATGQSALPKSNHSLGAVRKPFSATERFINSSTNATANVNTAVPERLRDRREAGEDMLFRTEA
jgi:hypothetical protein